MKKLLIRTFAFLTGNSLGQRFLGCTVFVANYFRGMGSGSAVHTSGELAVLKILVKGAMVFDVGANIGNFAEEVLRSDPTVRLHCFEPSWATFARLQAKVTSPMVQLNHFGLGADDSEMTLYSDGDASGLASLSQRKIALTGVVLTAKETVRIRRLSDYCREKGIDRIDLLKIDVEGHEMSVLEGAREMLSSRRIGMVMFEFGGCNIDSRTFFRDFHEFFTGLRAARMWRLTPSGWMQSIEGYDEGLECFTTANYVVQFD